MWQDIAYDADKNIVSLTVATPAKILAQNTYRCDGNGQEETYRYDNASNLL